MSNSRTITIKNPSRKLAWVVLAAQMLPPTSPYQQEFCVHMLMTKSDVAHILRRERI